MKKENKSKRYSVSVVGHFGFGSNLLNGQTIKTKIVTSGLDKKYGEDDVNKIDTHGGLGVFLRLPFQLFSACNKSDNILIFPAHNGVRIIAPLLVFFNHFFRKSLHYSVIGGWLPKMIAKKRLLKRCLSKFDGIYVETKTMAKTLVELGFNNIFVIPNCKDLDILKEDNLSFASEKPFKLCTFSRVMKQKGIEDAVEAVKKVNESCGQKVYELDIYGPIDEEETQWFDDLEKNFPDYIRYKGSVSYSETTSVLNDYFALVFPTRFYTEGIPGTIIDAYAAGLPVISSRWESFSDVVDEGVTGIGYEFGSVDCLTDRLTEIMHRPQIISEKKVNCIRKAKEFCTSEVITKFRFRGRYVD